MAFVHVARYRGCEIEHYSATHIVVITTHDCGPTTPDMGSHAPWSLLVALDVPKVH